MTRTLTAERLLAGKTYVGPSLNPRRRFKLWLSYPLAHDIDSWELRGRLPAPALRVALPGYQFVSCLQATPIGETWVLSSCEGKRFLVHFLPEWDPHAVWPCLETLERVCQSGLGDWQLNRFADGRFLLSTPLEGPTLKMHFNERWGRGDIGIPAPELLSYLRPAAQTLDELRDVYELQHLALNPHAILLQRGEVQLSGFGLAALLNDLGGRHFACNNPYYAAPEQYVGKISHATDSFSLALIYLAMRTGVHPWKNWTTDAAGADRPGSLDWSRVDRAELGVLRRGLALDPRKRFASCVELVDALENQGTVTIATGPSAPPVSLPALLVETSITPFLSTHQDWVAELVHLANKDKTLFTNGSVHLRLEPGKELVHRVGFRLSWRDLWERTDRFCQALNVKSPARSDLSLEMFVPLGNSRRGRSAGLKIQIENLPDDIRDSDVTVRLLPLGCWSHDGAGDLLHHEGPNLLHRLRQYLLEKPEQRQHPRHRWQERLMVHPVLSWAKLAAPVVALAQDVSLSGISLTLSGDLPTERFYLNCPDQRKLKAYAGLARVVRRTRLANGHVEIGATFASN